MDLVQALDVPDDEKGQISHAKDQSAERARRAERIVAMRRASFTFDRIGEELGISGEAARQAYWKVVKRHVARTEEGVEEIRAHSLEQLEAMLHRLWFEAFPSPTEVDATGKPVPQPVDVQAVDRILKAMDARARLLGLDAPTKHRLDVTQLNLAIAPLLERIIPLIPDHLVPEAHSAIRELMERQEAASLPSGGDAGSG